MMALNQVSCRWDKGAKLVPTRSAQNIQECQNMEEGETKYNSAADLLRIGGMPRPKL